MLAEPLGKSAHNWLSMCQRSVVANRRAVGSAQISWLGIVVSPGGEGVVSIAGLQKDTSTFDFE
jgi:hypothetical protein